MDTKIYEFRKLKSEDTFLMFRILGKIGVNEFTECLEKDSVKQMFGLAERTDDATTIMGMSVVLEVANIVLGNLPKCETEIYQLLSNTSNLSVKQVKELDFVVFMEMVIDFVKKEEFADFIKVASRLFKSAN